MIKNIIIIFALLIGSLAIAQDDNDVAYYANTQLNDAEREQRAFDLMLKLRCIQCQGQSIADSDAPIAQAMRHQVRLRIENGEQSEDIKNWMIARYGDYVSFEPPASGVSLLLWVGPIVIFLFAIVMVIPLFRRKKRSGGNDL